MNRTLHKILHLNKKFLFVISLTFVSWMVFAKPSTSEAVQVQVVKCYPNPATSIINFEFAKNIDKNYTLQIYSFLGKMMSENIVSANKFSVTLDNYFRGIYIYQLKDKAGRIVESGKFQVVR